MYMCNMILKIKYLYLCFMINMCVYFIDIGNKTHKYVLDELFLFQISVLFFFRIFFFNFQNFYNAESPLEYSK